MLDVRSQEYKQAAIAINYELEAVFNKNLEFFRSKQKNLYDLFKNYKSEKLKLRLSEEGYLNLYNVNTGQPVYPCNPIDYAKQQVTLALEKRPTFALNLTLTDQGRDDYPYTKCLVKLDRLYQSIYTNLSLSTELEVPQMFMFGGGLFLQLESLLNKLDIKSLSIFEPNHDSFYASMHVIDWAEILRYFERDGYSLNFNIIGQDQVDLVKLASIYYNKGFHHFPRIEQYYHYTNDELKNISTNFKNHLQTVIGSFGFFEDEKVGLTHTLVNIGKKIPICTQYRLKDKNNMPKSPVVLVGNGPSLDECETFLVENQENIIIVSCGSALSALLKKGIKPDIHIEQERMAVTPDWIEESTTESQRKGIKLIALNPCHPRTFDLFEERYMVIKPNDLGSDVMERLGFKNINYSKHCLPLVGNTGLSVVLGLGFETVYMVGIDCGMAIDDKHHSKDSNYYDNKSHHNDVISRNEQYGTFKIKGNYSGEVTTMPSYNYSRIEMQALLEKFHPDCYNLGDGAYIEGAIPLKHEDIEELKKIEHKFDDLNELMEENFTIHTLAEGKQEKLLTDVQKGMVQIIDVSEKLFDIEGLSKFEIIQRFDQLENILKVLRQTDKDIYLLASGSLKGLAYKLTVAKYNLKEKDFELFYSEAKVMISTFFNEVRDITEKGFLVYDD